MIRKANCRRALLAEAVEALRRDKRDLLSYVEDICDFIEAGESGIHALLPESGRRGRLLREAAALAQRFPDPRRRPVLFGALTAVKDIFHVQGFETQAGSRLPPTRLQGPEALVVKCLRQAGALVLGKSVTTEFAFFEPGPTRNPHHLDHTPGGSSSGSAAAVAAGYCPLALGTQTIGSIIRPAAYCGIVGFKPSFYRISADGLIYFSRSMDHVGFFTQDVQGAGLAAAVLCQAWRPVTQPGRPPRLGVPEGPYLAQTDAQGLQAFEKQLSCLEEAGCRIKRVPCLADIAAINTRHRQLVFAEFAREHRHLYAAYASLYRPRTREIIEIGKTVDRKTRLRAIEAAGRLRASLEALQRRHHIDLWLSPPAPGPAPQGLSSTGRPDMNLPWTHAGLPTITLPAGFFKNGLPAGLQIAAPFGADERLLAWSRRIAPMLGQSG